ncbi:MAG TPA: hypothetical protein VFY29_09405 [Terriglobia bacterium]|nr:hypothetical protein [Terriglobia bacterium]
MPRATKPVEIGTIYSKPTKCLHCHLVVEMFHDAAADPRKGAWECPQCGHKYLFTHWKIKRAVASRKPVTPGAAKRTREKPEAA